MAINEMATVIGDSVQVRGNLTGDEDLHVLGRIEGSINLERTLIVAISGVVKAEVQVKNAVVSGVVVGNITASESVEITREGRMVGDINAPRVIIVDGASFRGNVDMGDTANMPKRTPRERPATLPRFGASDEKASEESAKPAAAATPKATRPVVKASTKTESDDAPTKTRVSVPKKSSQKSGTKKPRFLDPPKAKSLPKKKKKKRVVVKRR